MKVGLIVPGFSADAEDWCIPVLRHLVQRLSRNDEVEVVALRYPYRAARYALFGARVRAMEPNGSGQRVVLELPDKMRPGDMHEFWLRVTLAPGQPIWPYYAIVPLDPCESGTVRVRFGARRPAEVWLLDEVPYTDLRNRPPGRTVIEPSALGEVVRDFHNLREGHGYGLAWTPLSVS